MKWIKVLKDKYYAGVYHEFLLYLNIHDLILVEEKFKKLDEFLATSPPVSEAKIVVFYNRGTGLRFPKIEMKEWFIKLAGIDEETFYAFKKSLPHALNWFNTILHLSRKSHDVKKILNEKIPPKEEPLIAVVLEYVETITPPNAPTGPEEADRDRYVILEYWARDKQIRENRNLIILITESLASIAPPMRSLSSGILPVKISFPNLRERRIAIDFLRKIYPPQEGDIDNQSLAFLTAGLTIANLLKIIKEAYHYRQALTAQKVFSRKKNILEEQSGGLITVEKPLWGMEAIGGLKPHKDFIRKVVTAMKGDDPLAVPMGILLVGPPGTGKTVFAEALAHESDVPLVIMKNIREMWVGQSERNLDLVYELIRAQAPVIVFQDEIDQQLQRRGEVFHGDSGVSARLAARQFQFMSDTTLRGRVVWLAATNRPDLLDPAILRPGRLDEKIPFLPPSQEERKDIIFALLRKMEIQARQMNTTFTWELLDKEAEEIAKRSCGYLDKSNKKFYKSLPSGSDPREFEEIPYTGAEIEVILRKAYTLAKEKGDRILKALHINGVLDKYIPTRDLILYQEMADLALQVVDSEQFLSKRWRKRAIELRARSARKLYGEAYLNAL